tara:strand:+ start:197 stop:583 length:387 start_codon:yes stop_codon:yes gene_type:complete
MTKLKTLLLLVLAGFILVACGSDEEEVVEAEVVVDQRADDKAALALVLIDEGTVMNSDIADCVANVMSENLDDDAWTLLNLFINLENEGNFDAIEAFILENDINEEAIDEAIGTAAEKAEVECDAVLE